MEGNNTIISERGQNGDLWEEKEEGCSGRVPPLSPPPPPPSFTSTSEG